MVEDLSCGNCLEDMTTYVYETIPQQVGVKPRCFEVKQSMNDRPLTEDPETGEPVRRVIMGGLGIFSVGKPEKLPQLRKGGCGSGCGCGNH